jgi:hypothetical protein
MTWTLIGAAVAVLLALNLLVVLILGFTRQSDSESDER